VKRRAGRGPHPEDGYLFADSAIARLRRSTAELSWLLSRGYAPRSSLKLVGDRHRLIDRQRVAVARCACDDQALCRRAEHEVSTAQLCGEELWLDGFNVITSLEAALAGEILCTEPSSARADGPSLMNAEQMSRQPLRRR
jgi:hypothetical protein